MQTGLELALMVHIASTFLSVGVVTFLLQHWLQQQTRLYTDLPLLFAIIFFGWALNSTMQVLTLSGLVENSLSVFKIRALILMIITLPLLTAVLVIWLAKYKKYHNRIMVLAITLWVSVTVLSPTETLILTLLIPPSMIYLICMIVTFGITWKTGRLEEVRSDLMVVSLLIGFISQIIKVPFQSAGMDWIPVSLAAVSAFLTAVALTNPWFYRKNGKDWSTQESSEYIYTVGV